MLVSHDAGAIERVCERVVVLDAGRIVFDGPTAEGLLHYHRLMGAEHGGGVLGAPASPRAVEVADVELLDRAGRRGQRVPHRRAAAGRGRPAARPGARAMPVWRSSCAAGDGAMLFRTATAVALGGDGGSDAGLRVPALALLGGDYDLALGAAAGGEAVPLDRTVRFSVASDSDGPRGRRPGRRLGALSRAEVVP